jgi:dUTP pyrophosphatase
VRPPPPPRPPRPASIPPPTEPTPELDATLLPGGEHTPPPDTTARIAPRGAAGLFGAETFRHAGGATTQARPASFPPPEPRHRSPANDDRVVVQVRLVGAMKMPLPAYQTDLAAGMDLMAAIEGPLRIAPLARVLVPTGIAIAMPAGFEGQVRPRSGLAWARGLTVLNAPGTIDADYRGEIKVLLVNLGGDDAEIHPGERIAQLVVARHARAELVLVDALEPTARGGGGYGSTGR